MFELTRDEYNSLRSQFATLEKGRGKYNKQFKDVYEAMNYLLQKDKKQKEQSDRKRIGYK